jgi:hypothetical protein
MSDVFIDRYFPDRDYKELPAVASRLRDLGAAAVWLPYSPDATVELEAAGYFPLFSYKDLELRIGKETPRGLQSFEDRLMEDADAIEKVAVLSRSDRTGEVALRQVFIIARADFPSD